MYFPSPVQKLKLVLIGFYILLSNTFGKGELLAGSTGEPVEIGGQWFLLYEYQSQDISTADTSYTLQANSFNVTRGYLNFRKKFNETFSARMTTDITIDEEGDGLGDIEVRLKYAYLQANLPDLAFLTNSYIEFGLVHRPWLDYEEHINHYRVQGKMFIDRSHVINSADYGITFVSLLGGKIDDTYQKNVSKSYPGKYGSLSVGIYNGGGYHAIESNLNKTVEGRISLRPFPAYVPGLQFSYHGVVGNGNTEAAPDLRIHQGFISYEGIIGTLTAQIANSQGDIGSGFWVDSTKTYKMTGGSAFGELRVPKTQLSLFSRYDFCQSANKQELDFINRAFIIGTGYYFTAKSKIIFNIDYSNHTIEGKTISTLLLQAGVEVYF